MQWFTLPYSANAATKDGKHFPSFLDKHFSTQNKFLKLCMPNLKTIMNSHNYKYTNPKTITNEWTCNCIGKAKCLLTQNCLINNIICKAVLTSTNQRYKEKIYFGTADTKLMLQYSKHQIPFKFLKFKTGNELSNKVWPMKTFGQTPIITWEILRECSPYNPNSKKKCYLCLNEKFEIAPYRENRTILKMQTPKQIKLSKYDTKDWRQLYYKKSLYCNFLFVNHIWLKILG